MGVPARCRGPGSGQGPCLDIPDGRGPRGDVLVPVPTVEQRQRWVPYCFIRCAFCGVPFSHDQVAIPLAPRATWAQLVAMPMMRRARGERRRWTKEIDLKLAASLEAKDRGRGPKDLHELIEACKGIGRRKRGNQSMRGRCVFSAIAPIGSGPGPCVETGAAASPKSQARGPAAGSSAAPSSSSEATGQATIPSRAGPYDVRSRLRPGRPARIGQGTAWDKVRRPAKSQEHKLVPWERLVRLTLDVPFWSPAPDQPV